MPKPTHSPRTHSLRAQTHARVTLQDVASSVGVSVSVVSRTFTPGASVSPDTRVRVLEAATKLGYRPNAIARSLSTRRSRMVALVVSYLHNQFYPTVIERISQRLQQKGYRVLLFVNEENVSDETQTDDLLLDMLEYQVDGIILASSLLSSRLAQHCKDHAIPVLLFNRASLLHGVSTVTSDNYEGGCLAARVLVHGGARRPAFIAGLQDASTSIEREQGFVDTLTRLNTTLYARAVGHYSFDGAIRAARMLFNRTSSNRPDAVFVANDHMAFGVLDVLRNECQLSVPDDVQVIGFDNVPQSAWGGYRLSTIEQDSECMSTEAVRILLEQMHARADYRPVHIRTPVRVVLRGTTRQPVNAGR